MKECARLQPLVDGAAYQEGCGLMRRFEFSASIFARPPPACAGGNGGMKCFDPISVELRFEWPAQPLEFS